VEDRGKHSDCDLMDNKYSCADSKNGFPNEQTNFEPSERINDSVSENLDGASLSEAPIPTDEQVIITTPPTKFVTAAAGDSTDVKALKRKMSYMTKKKKLLRKIAKSNYVVCFWMTCCYLCTCACMCCLSTCG